MTRADPRYRIPEFRANVGRRIRWDGDEPVAGTIVDLDYAGNGMPRYVVEWDEGAPAWWSTIISCANSRYVIEDAA